jgi:pimeloyl-ACP methyl ester carboxylesterase
MARPARLEGTAASKRRVRRVRGLAAICVSAGMLLLAAGPAGAALRFEPCGRSGFKCARLAVPLDRSGGVPGEVSLLIERYRAGRPRRPPLFVLAGGPGESATAGAFLYALVLDPALRGRDLIVFVQRGTGRSGLLRCPGLERARLPNVGEAVADCRRRLGGRSALYTTRESVEDIDAVRQAVGAERVALFGMSYGTKVAVAYALRHPQSVERLALDSVVEPAGPSALSLDSFAAIPRVLRALCRGGGCRQITPDPTRDLEHLVALLAQGPLHGTVITSRGKRLAASLNRRDLLALLLAGDFDGSLRLPFPAAVRSALRDDTAPILRLERRAQATLERIELPPRAFSVATNVATTCEETLLPWARTAPVEDRRRQATALVDSLPAAAFSPFDRLTALDGDVLRLCERWEASATAPTLAEGPAPDVPVLLLAGEDDLRTPVESARRVAARFASARLLVQQETGHIAFLSEDETCALRALWRFFTGGRVPAACPRDNFRLDNPTGVVPRSLRELRPVRGVRGRRGSALRALQLTVYDAAQEIWRDQIELFSLRDVTRAGGLRAGSLHYSASKERLRLSGYSFVPGVHVSGIVRRFASRRRVHGRVRLQGQATPDGLLRVRGPTVRGRLAGRRVRARLSLDLINAVVAAGARHASPSASRLKRASTWILR